MNFADMNALLAIAAAPIVNLDAPLPIEVTHKGRARAVVVRCEQKRAAEIVDADTCPHCGDDYMFCQCPPTAAEIAAYEARAAVDTELPDPAVEAGVDKAFRALFGDDYPTLAERLAESMKDDKRP